MGWGMETGRDTVGVKKYEERREKGRRMEYGREMEET